MNRKLLQVNNWVFNEKSVKSENPRLDSKQACDSVVQTSYDIVKAHK